jgi:hypothetical protein
VFISCSDIGFRRTIAGSCCAGLGRYRVGIFLRGRSVPDRRREGFNLSARGGRGMGEVMMGVMGVGMGFEAGGEGCVV